MLCTAMKDTLPLEAHVKIVLILTIKSIKVTWRQIAHRNLLLIASLLVFGGLYSMFRLTYKQQRVYLSSTPYAKLQFDYECFPKYPVNDTNASTIRKNVEVHCEPLDYSKYNISTANYPDYHQSIANMLLNVIKTKTLSTNHNDSVVEEQDNLKNSQQKKRDQTKEAEEVLGLLSSLMMNGLPLVGLDDFLILSDYANRYISGNLKNRIFSYTILRDKFANFFHVRDKIIVLTPDNCWTRALYSYLEKTIISFNDFNFKIVRDMKTATRSDNCCENVLAVIEVLPIYQDQYYYYVHDADGISRRGNNSLRAAQNQSTASSAHDLCMQHFLAHTIHNSSNILYNNSFIDGDDPVVSVTIRMPPATVPDTRNLQWNPLTRTIPRLQTGEILYFTSGFLSLQIEIQNFLRDKLFQQKASELGHSNFRQLDTQILSPQAFMVKLLESFIVAKDTEDLKENLREIIAHSNLNPDQNRNISTASAEAFLMSSLNNKTEAKTTKSKLEVSRFPWHKPHHHNANSTKNMEATLNYNNFSNPGSINGSSFNEKRYEKSPNYQIDQQARSIFFPLYHRAFPTHAYSQWTFFRVFTNVMTMAIIVLFSLPASLAIGAYRNEEVHGQIEVLRTLSPRIISLWHYLFAAIISAIVYTLLITMFFATIFFRIILLPATSILIPLLSLCAMGIAMSGLSGILVILAKFKSSYPFVNNQKLIDSNVTNDANSSSTLSINSRRMTNSSSRQTNNNILLTIPLLTFAMLLPGILYTELSYDINKSFFIEMFLTLLSPPGGCALLLKYLFRCESLDIPMQMSFRLPVSRTPVALIILVLIFDGVVYLLIIAMVLYQEHKREQRELCSTERQVKMVNHSSSISEASIAISAEKISKEFANQNLSTSYQRNAVQILSQISTALEYDKITVLLGSNGAGKTTFLRILALLDLNFEGKLTYQFGHRSKSSDKVNGKVVHNYTQIIDSQTNAFDQETTLGDSRLIGWCPQSDALYGGLTIEEHISLYTHLLGIVRIFLSAHQENITDISYSSIFSTIIPFPFHSNSEDFDINHLRTGNLVSKYQQYLHRLGLYEHRKKRIDQLSGGMKRRVLLLLSYIGEPAIVLLDEPSSGCDSHTRQIIRQFLLNTSYLNIDSKSSKPAILLSTHHEDEMEILADRVWFLNDHSLEIDATKQAILSGDIEDNPLTKNKDIIIDTNTGYQTFQYYQFVNGHDGMYNNRANTAVKDEEQYLPLVFRTSNPHIISLFQHWRNTQNISSSTFQISSEGGKNTLEFTLFNNTAYPAFQRFLDTLELHRELIDFQLYHQTLFRAIKHRYSQQQPLNSIKGFAVTNALIAEEKAMNESNSVQLETKPPVGFRKTLERWCLSWLPAVFYLRVIESKQEATGLIYFQTLLPALIVLAICIACQDPSYPKIPITSRPAQGSSSINTRTSHNLLTSYWLASESTSGIYDGIGEVLITTPSIFSTTQTIQTTPTFDQKQGRKNHNSYGLFQSHDYKDQDYDASDFTTTDLQYIDQFEDVYNRDYEQFIRNTSAINSVLELNHSFNHPFYDLLPPEQENRLRRLSYGGCKKNVEKRKLSNYVEQLGSDSKPHKHKNSPPKNKKGGGHQPATNTDTKATQNNERGQFLDLGMLLALSRYSEYVYQSYLKFTSVGNSDRLWQKLYREYYTHSVSNRKNDHSTQNKATNSQIEEQQEGNPRHRFVKNGNRLAAVALQDHLPDYIKFTVLVKENSLAHLTSLQVMQVLLQMQKAFCPSPGHNDVSPTRVTSNDELIQSIFAICATNLATDSTFDANELSTNAQTLPAYEIKLIPSSVFKNDSLSRNHDDTTKITGYDLLITSYQSLQTNITFMTNVTADHAVPLFLKEVLLPVYDLTISTTISEYSANTSNTGDFNLTQHNPSTDSISVGNPNYNLYSYPLPSIFSTRSSKSSASNLQDIHRATENDLERNASTATIENKQDVHKSTTSNSVASLSLERGFLGASIIVIFMMLTSVSSVKSVTRLQATQLKRQLHLHGVSIVNYYLLNILWDILLVLPRLLIILLSIYISHFLHFNGVNNGNGSEKSGRANGSHLIYQNSNPVFEYFFFRAHSSLTSSPTTSATLFGRFPALIITIVYTFVIVPTSYVITLLPTGEPDELTAQLLNLLGTLMGGVLLRLYYSTGPQPHGHQMDYLSMRALIEYTSPTYNYATAMNAIFAAYAKDASINHTEESADELSREIDQLNEQLFSALWLMLAQGFASILLIIFMDGYSGHCLILFERWKYKLYSELEKYVDNSGEDNQNETQDYQPRSSSCDKIEDESVTLLSHSQIRSYGSTQSANQNLKPHTATSSNENGTEYLLRVKDLCLKYDYSTTSTQILNLSHLNVDIPVDNTHSDISDRAIAIMAMNGGGKTTLFETLAMMQRTAPFRGEILLNSSITGGSSPSLLTTTTTNSITSNADREHDYINLLGNMHILSHNYPYYFENSNCDEKETIYHRNLMGYVSQEGGLPLFLTARECILLYMKATEYTLLPTTILTSMRYYSILDQRYLTSDDLSSDRYAREYSLEVSAESEDLGGVFPIKYINFTVQTLSGGTKKKLFLLLTMLSRPAILLLDECTTGIDPIAADQIINYLKSITYQSQRAAPSTILFASHRVEESTALCGRVLLLAQGEKRLDTRLEHFEALAAQYYQVDIQLLPSTQSTERQLRQQQMVDHYLMMCRSSFSNYIHADDTRDTSDNVLQAIRYFLDAFFSAVLQTTPITSTDLLIESMTPYSPISLRLTFHKSKIRLSAVWRILDSLQENRETLERYAFRVMEMEDMIAAIMQANK